MRLIYTLIFALINTGLWAFPPSKKAATAYVSTLKKVTDIMVYDVTSPVASARYYAYINLAAYETLSQTNPSLYPSMAISLKLNWTITIEKDMAKDVDVEQAVLFALLKAGEKLLPSGSKLKLEIDALAQNYEYKYKNKGKTGKSAALADKIVSQIANWAYTDGFRQLNNLQRYTPKQAIEFWKPTSPAFMAAVEPHWRKVRTFILDSAHQFKPLPPTPYDTTSGSSFYVQVKEVRDVVNARDKNQQAIAQFWDCNPYAISQMGHIEFGTKKISPGGHWMGIAGIACKKQKTPLPKTVLIHTLLAITMHDAFVACWDEKYRSNRVRPETVIKTLFDPLWRPLLQTPPFPEYVSGHSVVSSASALILSQFFGDSFSYTDDTETEFGLPKRKYKSFQQAADEACISRFYGGIHYIDAIEQGKWQGKMVGEEALKRLAQFFSVSVPK
jgi:PAP2 superfamily